MACTVTSKTRRLSPMLLLNQASRSATATCSHADALRGLPYRVPKHAAEVTRVGESESWLFNARSGANTPVPAATAANQKQWHSKTPIAEICALRGPALLAWQRMTGVLRWITMTRVLSTAGRWRMQRTTELEQKLETIHNTNIYGNLKTEATGRSDVHAASTSSYPGAAS